jgi:hypothetical protein
VVEGLESMTSNPVTSLAWVRSVVEGLELMTSNPVTSLAWVGSPGDALVV